MGPQFLGCAGMSDSGQYAQQSFLRGADVAVRVALECDVVSSPPIERAAWRQVHCLRIAHQSCIC